MLEDLRGISSQLSALNDKLVNTKLSLRTSEINMAFDGIKRQIQRLTLNAPDAGRATPAFAQTQPNQRSRTEISRDIEHHHLALHNMGLIMAAASHIADQDVYVQGSPGELVEGPEVVMALMTAALSLRDAAMAGLEELSSELKSGLEMLPKPKITLLHVAKSRLRLSDEDYRAILQNYGGASSSRDLDATGFNAVMDRFRELGFESTARSKVYGERVGMASPGQVAMIRKLWEAYAERPEEANLNTFLEHLVNVSALRFLPADKVSAVITALKAMVERKARANAG